MNILYSKTFQNQVELLKAGYKAHNLMNGGSNPPSATKSISMSIGMNIFDKTVVMADEQSQKTDKFVETWINEVNPILEAMSFGFIGVGDTISVRLDGENVYIEGSYHLRTGLKRYDWFIPVSVLTDRDPVAAANIYFLEKQLQELHKKLVSVISTVDDLNGKIANLNGKIAKLKM